jgi:wyosine [tRNA(Phe)-imidazoG37] synthetase (radical SAM superfamily)
MITFGPVPSRRLGHSLGINNIPPKSCSYSCLYCQVGRTVNQLMTPQAFYRPEDVVEQVTARVDRVQARGETIDVLTFVPDGEPTLDVHLGRAIDRLKPLGLRIAVITNGSLLWQPDVRANLAKADWVSVKVDAYCEAVWRQVNRPHAALQYETVLDGMRTFAALYAGELVTETMLLEGINDSEQELYRVVEVLADLKPAKVYIAIPTRPTAEMFCLPASEEAVNRAYQIMVQHVPEVELLTGYEGTTFAFSGDTEQDLLSITAVHPMRQDAVRSFLEKGGATWGVVRRLMHRGLVQEVEYRGRHFYVRRFPAI